MKDSQLRPSRSTSTPKRLQLRKCRLSQQEGLP